MTRSTGPFQRAILCLALLTMIVALAPSAKTAPDEEDIVLFALQVHPARVEVTTGSFVTWVNREPLNYPAVRGVHKLVADNDSFTSPAFGPGVRWGRAFELPGVFRYHCRWHTWTSGEIVVTGPPLAPPDRP